ncbi:uncharacterized protein AKAW2_30131A [Aspergillus luchuensis]|uniref:Uncharacterized protein n=1 Tax=Aspergillus kawachii TaxID=1069201 RepID=A0A7R7ZXI0_ASPKA|nr:uncharacterized protein AKAW2_30131A [Aspergillus luchuensis]BCR96812.1 hypothetical protein AKAW2_30131A [Aspergillus luchuensis]
MMNCIIQRHAYIRLSSNLGSSDLAVRMGDLVGGSGSKSKWERNFGIADRCRGVQVRDIAKNAWADLIPVEGIFVVFHAMIVLSRYDMIWILSHRMPQYTDLVELATLEYSWEFLRCLGLQVGNGEDLRV